MVDKELVLKYCLQNAIFYKGKADAGAVMGKVLGEKPELKKDAKEVMKTVQNTVKKVNRMALKEQKKKLKKLAPELLEKEEKEQGLPELENAEEGKVVTRFAPAPTGPLHIAHLLRAAGLSYIYARRYRGRFLLRFEDTNPRKIKKRFYSWILEDLKAAGIKPEKVLHESDNMKTYYKHARMLMEKGAAYVCECPAEKFRKLKLKKKNCPCRDRNRDLEKMIRGDYREGEAVLRLKTSMGEKNPVLRDPPLMRIVEGKHPRTGTKYKAWPLYNFVNSIEDYLNGITHIFRAKEHEHNTAVQERIYRFFGWNTPDIINFGMVYLPGTKMHTRDIKKGIKEGKYSGWDDVRLPTVRALLRRGFLGKSFLELAKVCGLSKTDITMGWENLEGINRKIIDPLANRYMVVRDPVRIDVSGGGKIKKVKMDKHPDFPERGKRTMPVDRENIWISKKDFRNLKGKMFRLIGLGNVELTGKKAEYRGDKIVKKMRKIQWVSEPNMKVKVLAPDGKWSGLGEQEMGKLKEGTLIQMERIGFCRVDSVKGKKIVLVFAHK